MCRVENGFRDPPQSSARSTSGASWCAWTYGGDAGPSAASMLAKIRELAPRTCGKRRGLNHSVQYFRWRTGLKASNMEEVYTRPATPQPMLHRLPDKSDTFAAAIKPSRLIVLITASTAVAGKVQIAKTVATAFGCPLFQGDSLHETAAKAASVGAPAHATSTHLEREREVLPTPGANESRYQRMWLSKMTRTGLLFPESSRPANSGFAGSGGTSSSSGSSRRGSGSSVDSMTDETGSSASSIASLNVMQSAAVAKPYINKPPAPYSSVGGPGQSNAVLMVLTLPILLDWHRRCIRAAVKDYSIGMVFVPLDVRPEPPMLKVLDPRTMTTFSAISDASVGRMKAWPDWSEEVVLEVDVEARVETIAEEIVEGVLQIVKD